MRTLIVGQHSNLTQGLAAAWPHAVPWSSRALLEGADLPLSPSDPLRVVINAFQPARQLQDVSDPVGYVARAIGATAQLLAQLEAYDVRRILYTSSAAVYGDNVECREGDRPRAAGLHASLKAANEDLVYRVGRLREIPTTVVRLFNMYGGHDEFSIVSKLVGAARNGSRITLVNEGNAIRDFIHVDDVVASYTAILDHEVELINVASGVGSSIRGLVDALALRGIEVATSNVTRHEIRVSTANVDRLSTLVDVRKFRRATDWVVEECLK